MQTHAGIGPQVAKVYGIPATITSNRDGFGNCVTLIFDLLTYGSVHAERLLYSIREKSLVLIARAVFLLERQTDKQTDATERPTHDAGGYAGVGDELSRCCNCCQRCLHLRI